MNKQDKTEIGYLRDLLRDNASRYNDSYERLAQDWDYYLGNQLTPSQLAKYEQQNIIPQVHNIYAKTINMVVGHIGSKVNTVKITGQQQSDAVSATALNHVVNYIFRQNQFDTSKGARAITEAALSGIFAVYAAPTPLEQTDRFGRRFHDVIIDPVPITELVLDANSVKDDYSDAKHISRLVWVTKDRLHEMFPDKTEIIEGLQRNLSNTYVHSQSVEYKRIGVYSVNGVNDEGDYQLVNTFIEDDEGKVWSIYWSGNSIIEKVEVTYHKFKFPYTVFKTRQSPYTEFYGIMKDAKGHQDAINRTLAILQEKIGWDKPIIEKGAVKDIRRFLVQLANPRGVVQVENPSKITWRDNKADIAHYSRMLQEDLDRVDNMLGLNPAFYGYSSAGDSGRKVELQQQRANNALEVFSGHIEQGYRLLARHVAHIVQQYYTHNQTLQLVDERLGVKWFEINKPEEFPVYARDEDGNVVRDETGEPIIEVINYYYEEALDPGSLEPLKDDDGNPIMVPMPTEDSEIHANFDPNIIVDSTSYDKSGEQARMLTESVINSNYGLFLQQNFPAEYTRLVNLSLQQHKTEQSAEIQDILKSVETQIMQATQGQQGGQNAQQ